MKKTLFQLALAAAGVAAVSVAQAQPAPAPPAPPPAPTTTADPNAPPATPPPPPATPPTTTAAPVAPPPATPPVTPPVAPTADPNAPPATPPATPPMQGDPNAPPPPPPVQPPPAQPQGNTTPPAAPFVPPPPPAAQWNNGNPQGGDAATPTVKAKPLAWRGTSFEWYQYANTQYFGLGAPYGGQQDFAYVHLFRFAPQFYLVDLPKDKLVATATLWGSVEATNSNTTLLKNEFEIRDTPIGLKYTRTVMQSPDQEGTPPEWFTKAGLSGGISLPTSKASSTYRYMALNLGASASQQIALSGSKSDLFPNMNIGLSAAYAHSFNKANVPFNEGATNIPRQTLSGNSFVDDQFGKFLLTTDTLLVGAALTLPIYKDLSFAASYRYWMRWKPKPTDGCVDALTGCAPGTSAIPNPTTFSADTILDISVAYNFFDVLDASIGYSNWRGSIGESGKANTQLNNVFYSPDATFYLDLTANLDSIYSKAVGRDKKATAKGSSSSWF